MVNNFGAPRSKKSAIEYIHSKSLLSLAEFLQFSNSPIILMSMYMYMYVCVRVLYHRISNLHGSLKLPPFVSAANQSIQQTRRDCSPSIAPSKIPFLSKFHKNSIQIKFISFSISYLISIPKSI